MTKSRDHRCFLASLPCAVCGDDSAMTDRDVHHLLAERHRIGRKAGDHRSIPLCRKHHDGLHQTGREETYLFIANRIDGRWLAGALWGCSGDYETACDVIALAKMPK